MENSKLGSGFSESSKPKPEMNTGFVIAFTVFISSAWIWPILPFLIGLEGWEVLGWFLVALLVFSFGLLLLIIVGLVGISSKKTTPSTNNLGSPPASIIIESNTVAPYTNHTTQAVIPKGSSRTNGMVIYAGLTFIMIMVSFVVPAPNVGTSNDVYPELIPIIRGCTDSNALNYDSYANIPDGSCVYEVVPIPSDADADPCDLIWPDDPFHSAIYSFIAEYALDYEGAVGCYDDNYGSSSYASAAFDLEDHWSNSYATYDGNASSYAQDWVVSNADDYGKESFDLYMTFKVSEGGLGMQASHSLLDCTEGPRSGNSSNSSMFTIKDNPNIDQPAYQCFNKFIEVFGLGVFAESGITDSQMIHAATVLAELLDNDEDGVVDDTALHNRLLEVNATVPMFNAEGSPAEYYMMEHYQGEGIGAVLYSDEVDPNQTGRWGDDASVEEIMHTINMVGHVHIYPNAFGLEPNSSLLTEAMDVARGGQFLEVPSSYPNEAWYHYTDTTCEYGCMAGEYIYWAQVTNMGILNDTETCDGIADEWEPCSKELLESMDILIYDLVTDPLYKLPQIAPDGVYSPESE